MSPFSLCGRCRGSGGDRLRLPKAFYNIEIFLVEVLAEEKLDKLVGIVSAIKRFDERLNDERTASAVGRQIVIGTEPMRAGGARGNRWLHNEPIAVELTASLFKIGVAAGFDSHCRDAWNSALGEFDKIGLVPVPAKQGRRIDHRPAIGLGSIEQFEPARIFRVIAPGDERRDEIEF